MDSSKQTYSKGKGAVCVISSLALSVMMVPAVAAGSIGASLPEAQAASAGAPAVTAKATIAKSGSSLSLEKGDKATLTLKKFKVKKASSSKKKLVTAKASKGKLVVTAKATGKATVTAKAGKKSFKVKVTVKKEGSYSLETGAKLSLSVKGAKKASSSASRKIAAKASKGKVTLTAKKAGNAVITVVLANKTTRTFVVSAHAPANTSISADRAIKGIKVHAFVDIDGAKTDAVIVEYASDVTASSVSASDYKVTDYATYLASQGKSFERGNASTAGTVTKAYVNSEPAPSSTGGTTSGRYVVLEVNTDYMLAGNTPAYTTTLMAGVTQTGKVTSEAGTVTPTATEKANYTTKVQDKYNREGKYEGKETVINTDKSTFLIPQFDEGTGWTVGETFHATKCYSEYDGTTSDFDFPYSIYVPELTAADRGKVAVDLHIEDAGALGDDPMYALTESQAPADLSSAAIQAKQKTIVIVPQVEESRRAADDNVATSEMNPAFWELLDSVIAEYKDYVNTDRIYGTGQSMGGMTLMDMAEQRDNYFAGFLIFGSQWSNSYNKDSQHKDASGNGVAARNGTNDTVTFTDEYPYSEDVDNWYYRISDDNVMVLNCTGDQMSYSLWKATSEYFENAGVTIPHDEWFASASVSDQDSAIDDLAKMDSSVNIRWGSFRGGDHMSTWKYGYDLNETYTWLFSQTRASENARGKVEALNEEYKGRDANGKLISKGTKGMNSAQYTPRGADESHAEGWKPSDE